MLFFLKQLLKAIIMPLPGLLLMGFLGLFLLWTRRRPRLGLLLVTGAMSLLLIASIGPLEAGWGTRLERSYPAYGGEPVDFVVVLGSGHISDPELPLTAWPSSTALFRLAEGLRLAQMNPEARVLFSGFGGTDKISAAEVSRRLAVELGLDSTRITLDPQARDTRDEARFVAPVVRGHPFALVTSATHMARAVAIFQAEGLHPIPAPTGHLVRRRSHLAFLDLIPSSESLVVTRELWYETLGRIWSRVRPPVREGE